MNAWLTQHPWWGAIGIVAVFVAIASLVTVLIGDGPTDDVTGPGSTTSRASDAALNGIALFNRAQPELILAKPETLLVTVLAEQNPALVGTTLEEVAQVCTLLQSLGILTRVNGEGFVMETSPQGARQLLAAATGVGEPHGG